MIATLKRLFGLKSKLPAAPPEPSIYYSKAKSLLDGEVAAFGTDWIHTPNQKEEDESFTRYYRYRDTNYGIATDFLHSYLWLMIECKSAEDFMSAEEQRELYMLFIKKEHDYMEHTLKTLIEKNK